MEARILLAHVLGWQRTELITRADEILPASQIAAFQALEKRRLAGEPMAQIIEQREFFGLTFRITPAVLIPRPETELLVELALASIASIEAPQVLDLGTGSGAIAIAIAHQRPDAQITATDQAHAALALAKWNAHHLLPADRPGGPLNFAAGDWYHALATPKRFNLIVSNPPYIAAHDPHLTQGDLRFEPRHALTDQADGLSALHTIIAQASAWLLDSGALWLEHGYNQAAATRAQLIAHGFSKVRSERDLAHIERVSGGLKS
ncbi:release factor glutamine methyltransferase [Mycoavidus sp. B2-EB]|nr:peptide chain release factor N(5)-glutamine methyltransferase [Mycoavidus sp. B2-EB]BBO59259.1 release factor glutamine methyltransferase [Mycoavidus sp. B2-EB]